MAKREIEIGDLRHRVKLQSASASDPTPSPSGTPPQSNIETWSDLATYWAKVEPQQIRRTIGVDTPRPSLWYLVTMRNPGPAVAITNANRFLYRGKVLAIDSVQRVGEMNEFLEIEVTENQA